MYKVGEYIGAEELFKGKRGAIIIYGEVVKMQFDDGPEWMTNSWITFPAGDVVIDNEEEDNNDDAI